MNMAEKIDILEKIGFEVVHLGINANDQKTALAVAQCFEMFFGWPVEQGTQSIYAGPKLEIMKGDGRGTHGHIAVAVNDIHEAKAYLERKGCTFRDESAKYDAEGNLIVIYLKDEIAGFAVHLLQR